MSVIRFAPRLPAHPRELGRAFPAVRAAVSEGS